MATLPTLPAGLPGPMVEDPMACRTERAADLGPELQPRLFQREAAPATVLELVRRGALFVVNHSGGKDSQAMLIVLRALVPHRQLLIVHAEMPGVEWEGTQEHIHRYAYGIPVLVARASRTFWDMVESRGKFPSPMQRQCTSDLKRGPIEREIRRYLSDHPEFNGLVVNCMGLRAGESARRAQAHPLKLSKRNSKAGREWYDYLPIHDLTTAEVFEEIALSQQQPHWVYRAGMTRKSCVICIMSSEADMRTAARLNPEVVRRYVDTERRLNFTLSMNGRSLAEITGLAA